MNLFKTMGFKAGVVSALILVVFLTAWYAATYTPAGLAATGLTAEQIEYQKMMGKDPGAKSSGFPHAHADGPDLR